jgi:hypothetical protein
MADPVIKKIDTLADLVGIAAAGDKMVVIVASEPDPVKKTKLVSMTQLSIHTPSQLATNVVENSQITDGAVTNSKLGADAVDGAKIADDSIDSEHYVDGSIDAAHLNQTSGAQAVTTATIRDLNVTNGKLAAGAVTEAKITAKTITNASLADKTVTTAKIADEAVTEAQLGAIKRMIMIPVFGLEDAVIVKNFTRIMAWHPDLNGHIVTGAWAALLGHESTSGTVTINLINAGGQMCAISIPQGGWSAQSGSISTSYDDVSSLASFSVNVTAQGVGAFGLTIYLEVTG